MVGIFINNQRILEHREDEASMQKSRHRGALRIHGEICPSEASELMRITRMSPEKEKWKLLLEKCYGKEDSLDVIGKVLSSMHFDSITVESFDTETSTFHDMLVCVFCALSAGNSCPREIYFIDCVLDTAFIPIMREWSRVVSVHQCFFNYRCRWVGDETNLTGFFSETYKGLQNSPRSLSLSSDVQQSDFGDLSVLHSCCSLRSICFSGGGSFAVRGLSSLTQLTTINISEVSRIHGNLQDTGILKLLSQKDCRLKWLKLGGTIFSSGDKSMSNLFEALTANKSLRGLEIRCSPMNHLDFEKFLQCVINNRTLTSVCFDGSILAEEPDLLEQLVRALSTANATLQAINPQGNLASYVKLIPYMFRNWAGRKLLLNTNQVPLALWPFVLSRIRNGSINNLGVMFATRSQPWARFDAMYHLVRGCGMASLFKSSGLGKRKGSELHCIRDI